MEAIEEIKKYLRAEIEHHKGHWFTDDHSSTIKAILEKVEEIEQTHTDYKRMAQEFVGDELSDMYCNGFFGRIYDLDGAEITRIYDSDYDDAIVIEVRKEDGKYEYGYFDSHWRDWESVYKTIKEWING